MGTTLSGTQIKNTYVGILKTTDNAVASGSLKVITDGEGNDTALSLSTSQVKVTNLLINSPATSTSDEILVRDSSTGLIGKRTLPNLRTVQSVLGTGSTTNGAGSAIPFTLTDSGGHSSTISFQSKQNITLRSASGTLNFKYDTRDVTKVSANHSISAANELGTTVFLDAATLSGGTLTLPAASEGRFLRIYVDVGSDTAVNINAGTDDYFYGSITHVSTTDNKISVQRVLRATAASAVSTHNQITLDQNHNNIGGAAGSHLELTCFDSAGWFVAGTLIGNSTVPTSIAAINGQ
tara:strand:+ start:64 stop:945 length:882 start_codon:yes stop_codon:yes gene_type:complete